MKKEETTEFYFSSAVQRSGHFSNRPRQTDRGSMLKSTMQSSVKKLVLIICGLTIFLIIFFFDDLKEKHKSIPIEHRLKSMSSGQSDYNYLININFTFKILPLVCKEEEDSLLILVHSSPDHFSNRKVIRETWGQHDDDIRLLFLVGTVEDSMLQEKLEQESYLNKDLLQGNFIDSYHNLTYKHVMALKYVVYHCSKAQFLLKVDDDVFINMPTLKTFIKSFTCEYGKSTKIMCSVLYNPPVLREGRWEASLEDFPEETYPNHCSGFAILYPQEIIYTLYDEAQNSKFFWIDDVFISGVCAKKKNISHITIENLILSNENLHNIVTLSFTNVTKPFLLGRFNLNENEIRSLWKFVINNKPKSILDYLE